MIQSIKNKKNIAAVLLASSFAFSSLVYAETAHQPSIDISIGEAELTQPTQENIVDGNAVDSAAKAPVGTPSDNDSGANHRDDAHYTDFETCFTCT